mgnify:CR=1 FL=1
MKKFLLLGLMMFSFYTQAQIVNSSVRAYLSPNFINLQVWNLSPYNANCRGFLTAVNMQTNRYFQFFYNQYIWSGNVGYQNFYLGPYNNGMAMRIMHHNITCFAQP